MRTTTIGRARSSAELREHRGVGLEVRQVVLLLEALVGAQLAARAVALQALRRDRVGHDHRARQAAVDVVLDRRPLVVEHRRARDPQQRGGDAHVVGAVAERDVEARRRPRARRRAPSARARPSARRGRRPWPRAARRDGGRSRCGRCRSARTARSSGRSRARSPAPRGRRRCRRSITGRMTSTCGLFVRSIQTRIGADGNGPAPCRRPRAGIVAPADARPRLDLRIARQRHLRTSSATPGCRRSSC